MNIVYFNGIYIKKDEAKIGIQDQGFIFADGLYEVFLAKNERFIDFELHIKRLQYGLEVLKIEFDTAKLQDISKDLLIKNNVKNALVYFQITRGEMGERKHGMPTSKNPTVIGMLLATRDGMDLEYAKCITESDARWARRDIKTIGLLPNIMAKQKAIDLGFDDAIFVDGTIVTEATSANVLVVKNQEIWTHPATNKILNGITKQRIEFFAKDLNIPYLHKCFTVDQMLSCDEIFLTSAGTLIRCVSYVDGKQIGNGTYPVFEALRQKMKDFIL